MVFSSKKNGKKRVLLRHNAKISIILYTKKKMITKFQWNKYEDWQQQHYTPKVTQKQWEQLFLSLCKNKKQKEAFGIQYKSLYFAQPFLTRLREIRQNYGSIECDRCNRPDETQKHWLFSCASS